MTVNKGKIKQQVMDIKRRLSHPVLDNATYTQAVEHGRYPANPLVPLGEVFTDDRGEIVNLVCGDFKTASTIFSKAGTERSNHYHLTDYHYLFVVFGEMEYYERQVHEPHNDVCLVVKAGEMVFTPPNVVHKTVFRKDTLLLSIAKNIRNHNEHEQDVVREKF